MSGRIPYPRRSRCGLAALTAMLGLSVLLASAFLAWQTGQARNRIAGQGALLADMMAARAYALHHWLHGARTGAGFGLPPQDTARRMTATEQVNLRNHAATAPWRIPARGWQVVPLVAGENRTGDGIPRGVIVLRPPAGADLRLRAEVARRTGAGAASDAAQLAGTATALSPRFDATRDIAVLAHRFARIDRGAVLRSPQAGYPATGMGSSLDMNGNTITGVGGITGDLAVTGTLEAGGQTATGALTADRLELARDLTVDGTLKANHAAIDRIEDAVQSGSRPDLKVTGEVFR